MIIHDSHGTNSVTGSGRLLIHPLFLTHSCLVILPLPGDSAHQGVAKAQGLALEFDIQHLPAKFGSNFDV